MILIPLPYRPPPVRDELLLSWIGRLARANHCSVEDLCGYLGLGQGRVAEHAGDLRAMNWDRLCGAVLAAARARGKKLGRQPGQYPKSDKLAPQVLAAVEEGRSYRWIARDLGISKTTVPVVAKQYRKKSLECHFAPYRKGQRWSRNFGPVVKVDRMMKVTIQCPSSWFLGPMAV
ncbi:TniQ family protein [uncultured Tateyamaria sp.]|uniref:TniQ family protein n=1 Tax=uncultured Tateyamaria sp. TaxID=455651 RepID=UPI002609FE3C|nr:TniQ family protein [uncultured Tateyamaria sp.]